MIWSGHDANDVVVAGIPFRATSLEQAIDWTLNLLSQTDRSPTSIRLANAYTVALASTEPRYARLLSSRGVNFPDGTPIVAVMRALGADASVARRVRGPSFFREMLRGGVPLGVRHFFLGSTPETLQALTAAAKRSYPGVKITGSYSPPFRRVDEVYLDELVELAKGWDADVVWVGMGTPKQDFVADALAARAAVTAVGIGAGFDFVAGSVKEAPRWMRYNGLEWVYRFAMEPARLWRRYILGNARFVGLVLPQLLRSGALHRLISQHTMQRNSSA